MAFQLEIRDFEIVQRILQIALIDKSRRNIFW